MLLERDLKDIAHHATKRDARFEKIPPPGQVNLWI